MTASFAVKIILIILPFTFVYSLLLLFLLWTCLCMYWNKHHLQPAIVELLQIISRLTREWIENCLFVGTWLPQTMILVQYLVKYCQTWSTTNYNWVQPSTPTQNKGCTLKATLRPDLFFLLSPGHCLKTAVDEQLVELCIMFRRHKMQDALVAAL